MKSTKPNRRAINEFFSTIYGLTLFMVKSLYIIISDSTVEKEARTYKEEREQQKKKRKRDKKWE